MANIKYKDNGEYKDIVVKVGDTSPIGLVADYDGSVVPNGWEEIKNILWENPNPTSTFAGSQVTLNDNISNYEYYEVYYNFKKDNVTCMSMKAPVTQATYLIGVINYLCRRKIEAPSGTSITIGDDYFNGAYAQGATLDNDYLIPTKIIGYKKQIKKIAPVTPANGNIKNSYGTSQTDTYSQEYLNGKVESGNWTLITNNIYYKKVGNVVTLIRQARDDDGRFIQNEITLTGYDYTNIATTLPEEIRPSKRIAYNILAHIKNNTFYTQAYGEIQTDGNLSVYNWGVETILDRLAFCVTYIVD